MILILLIILLILVCLLIAMIGIKDIKITGGKKKKFNNNGKFLFPVFGTYSKNKLLYIDPKDYISNRKLKINNLHKTDIRSIILQTYNYPDQIGIVNYILEKLIYPIDFKMNNSKIRILYKKGITKHPALITAYNLPKLHISNWQIPSGLYLHKILEENECDILSKYLIEFFKKNLPSNILKLKYYTSMDIKSMKYYMIQKVLPLIKRDKKLYPYITNIIDNFFKILYENESESNINILYKKLDMIISHHSGHLDKISKGLNLHTDRLGMAATSIISLENSILDFVPWEEILDKLPSFRVIIPKGYMITFDGDIRHYYAHSVPPIEYPNNVRLSINFRQSLLNPEKNTNCTDQFANIAANNNFKCISSSFDNPLKFEY